MGTSVACIIYNGEKLLIAHRNPTGDMGNRWEFPGGKVDAGETCEQAVIREMREEFGVKAEVFEQIASSSFEHKGKTNSLKAFLVSLEHDGSERPYVLTEHTEYKWVIPSEIADLEFVDSDLKIYPEVLKYLSNKK